MPGGLDPPPLKAGITHVRIEKHQAVRHRNQREDKAKREQKPRIDVGQRVGRGQKPVQHLLSDIVAEADGRRNFAQMRQRQIERDRKGEIGQERQDANQLQKIVSAIDEPDQHQAPEKAGNDVERGESHRLHRAAQQAAEIGLGEKASVDHDFDDEQDRQNAGLQNDLAGTCQPRRALDAMVLAKLLALDLGFVEPATQDEKLVAADGGFGAKIADRLRRGLLDGRKALLETERVHPLVIGVELVEIDDIGILLVRLDALDDLVFDVVQRLRVGWSADFPPRARCRARPTRIRRRRDRRSGREKSWWPDDNGGQADLTGPGCARSLTGGFRGRSRYLQPAGDGDDGLIRVITD